MKLATKLLTGLFAVLTLLIVWQIWYSKDIVKDFSMLKNNVTYETLQNAKEYVSIVSPFDSIEAYGLSVHIIRGDQHAVFYSPKLLHDTPSIENRKLIIGDSTQVEKIYCIYIVTPEIKNLEIINPCRYSKLFGFSGKEIPVQFKRVNYMLSHSYSSRADLNTDSPSLDLSTNCYLSLTVEKPMENLKVQAYSGGAIRILELSVPIQNLSIRAYHSDYMIRQQQPDLLRNIRISGVLSYHSSINSDDSDTLKCDTLQIDVTSERSVSISLAKYIQAQSVSINKSDNIYMIGGQWDKEIDVFTSDRQ